MRRLELLHGSFTSDAIFRDCTLRKELRVCSYNSATEGATLLKRSANSSAYVVLPFYVEKKFSLVAS